MISRGIIEIESLTELRNELNLSLLPVTDHNYTHPTPSDLRLVLNDAGLTQAAAAEILDVTSRTMRGWLEQKSEKSSIPFSAWRALVFELRLIDPNSTDPVCANWWLVNNSVMAESFENRHVTSKIGPYTSYRTANNAAAQKNAESFAQYLSDHLHSNEIEISDPEQYEYWNDVREEWLASNAVIYQVVHSRDLDCSDVARV